MAAESWGELGIPAPATNPNPHPQSELLGQLSFVLLHLSSIYCFCPFFLKGQARPFWIILTLTLEQSIY